MEMYRGKFKYNNPIHMFVGYFRGYLGMEERTQINAELRKIPQKTRIDFLSADTKNFE